MSCLWWEEAKQKLAEQREALAEIGVGGEVFVEQGRARAGNYSSDIG